MIISNWTSRFNLTPNCLCNQIAWRHLTFIIPTNKQEKHQIVARVLPKKNTVCVLQRIRWIETTIHQSEKRDNQLVTQLCKEYIRWVLASNATPRENVSVCLLVCLKGKHGPGKKQRTTGLIWVSESRIFIYFPLNTP